MKKYNKMYMFVYKYNFVQQIVYNCTMLYNISTHFGVIVQTAEVEDFIHFSS